MPLREFALTNQSYYPGLGSETTSVWKFLHSFLRRHFAMGELVVASRNAGCFLRLQLMHLSKVPGRFSKYTYRTLRVHVIELIPG